MSAIEAPSTAAPDPPEGEVTWEKVVDTDAVEVGRVTTAVVGNRTFAVTRTEDGWGVLDQPLPAPGRPAR